MLCKMIRLVLAVVAVLLLYYIISMPRTGMAADIITMPYCQERSKLAIEIARAIKEGFTLDTINLEFLTPPVDKQDEEERQERVAELKGEIYMVMQEVTDPDLVGQKILERCAYRYGAQYRRTTVQEEGVRTDYCLHRSNVLRKLWDIVKDVGSKEEMLRLYPPSKISQVDAEALIDDILNAPDKGIWMENQWKVCMGQKGV